MNFHEFIALIFVVFVSMYILTLVIGNILRIFYGLDKYY